MLVEEEIFRIDGKKLHIVSLIDLIPREKYNGKTSEYDGITTIFVGCQMFASRDEYISK
jgi:hypothetical protein